MKTSELQGAALDWAVAVCEQDNDGRLTIIRWEDYIGHPIERETEKGSYTYEWWCPTRIWAQGGPIIERERISLTPRDWGWDALYHDRLFEEDGSDHLMAGASPLIAAMRCYVASKMGDTIDVPDELTNEQHTQS